MQKEFTFLDKTFSDRDYRVVQIDLLDVAPQTVEQLYQWCAKYNLVLSEVRFVETYSDDIGVAVRYLEYVEATTDAFKKKYDKDLARLKKSQAANKIKTREAEIKQLKNLMKKYKDEI